MPLKILSDGNPDGTLLGGLSTDRVGFWGQVPTGQRTMPTQMTIGAANFGQVVTFSSNSAALANIAAITTAEQLVTFEQFNVATSLGVNATADFIVGISKPTSDANVGISGFKANSTIGQVLVGFCNPTAANANISVNTVQWTMTSLRGFSPHVQNLVPTSVPLNATSEQIFTLGGTNAAATAAIANGGVTNIQVTVGGSGYYIPPTVVITAPVNAAYGGTTANTPTLLTGTALPFPIPTNGIGATAVAVIANGGVASVVVTDPGSGYTVAPTVSFVPSAFIAPGMFPVVQKNALQAGLGIGNVRVAGKNQVAIQYFNVSSANIVPTANEAYAFLGLTTMPAVSPLIHIRSNCTWAAVGVNAATNTSVFTVPGIQAQDTMIGCSNQVVTANANACIVIPGNCTANTLNPLAFAGVATNTPAAGTYNFTILRQSAAAPIQVFQALVTPASVAAIACAEQTFTLPGNITLSSSNNATNFNTLVCSKPSHTPYISVVGCRQVSNTTFAINFMNNNLTAAIIPPAEVYTFAYFPSPAATIGTNMAFSHTIQWAGTALYQTFNMVNELQQLSVLYGLMKGG